MKRTNIVIVCLLSLLLSACSEAKSGTQTSSKTEKKKELNVPIFSEDSAMIYLHKQCTFGPRVPNTAAHKSCGKYIANELERHGAKVEKQETELKAFDGTMLNACNIIGKYNPESKTRVAMFAHWDCRPFSDEEHDSKSKLMPVMGANDAASGVAVLLEVARLLNEVDPGIGVDLVMLDAEDYGAPDWAGISDDDKTWCLGTQYWAQNTGYTDNKPQWGILLDMVGGKNPNFAVDVISSQFAAGLSSQIWQEAKKLGFGNIFVNEMGGSIIDDHYFINQMTGIPTVDIIDYKQYSGFPEEWHTQKDTEDNIDKNTIGVVGRTIVNFLYKWADKNVKE